MPNAASTLTYRWFDQVWNNSNKNAIDELMSHDATVHGLDGITEAGAKGFKVFYDGFRQNFSDVKVEVEDTVSEAGIEAARCNVWATHIPSGTKVNFGGVTWVRVQNGKIVESWNYFDFLGMNQQLGLELTPVQNPAPMEEN